MNTEILQGKWHQVAGKARRKWGKLTDHDLTRIRGKKEELVGLIQEAYGKSQEEARREVEAFERECCF